MMMIRIALRSHLGDHDTENHLDFRTREEERRRGKPVLQGKLEEMGLDGRWDENFTKALDHLTPEAGGIRLLG